MKIWQDEIFAPVLSIVRVKSLDEAIEIANESRFANGACIYTDSGASVRQFRETIESGMLGVNVGVPAPMAFFRSLAGKTLSMVIFMRTVLTALSFILERKCLHLVGKSNL